MRLRVSLLLLLAAAASAAAGEIDTRLHDLLQRQVTLPEQASPNVTVHMRGGQAMVSVIIDGDPATLPGAVAAAGGRVRNTLGRRITADIPVSQIAALGARADLRRMEASAPVQLRNDLGNLPAGNASRTAAPTSWSTFDQGYGDGATVIAAAVDTGIDIFHPDFRNEDGTTRILYYWDQSDLTDSGTGVGLTYGREYDANAINAILRGDATLATSARDTHGHGSHVMGTIAGNGRASGFQHAGVAAKAPIVMVKFDFDGARNTSSHIVDAVDYCFRRANGTPCAVNLSLGSDFGPHDGTTLEETTLDALTGPGKVVFAAAGNAGELGVTTSVPLTHLPPAAPIHGAGDLSQGTVTIEVDVTLNALGLNKGTGNDYVFFDIWYEGGAVCDVAITTPGGTTLTDPRWRTGASGAGLTTFPRSGAVFVYNANDGAGNPDTLGWGTSNGDNELYVEISDYQSAGNVAEGTWRIELIPVGAVAAANGPVNGWHGLSTNYRGSAVRWNGAATDNRMTVGSPATATQLISVGAYTTRTTWTLEDGSAGGYAANFTVGTLSYFSSRGPDRLDRPHPAITAPGSGIVSVLSADAKAGWGAEYIVAGGMYGVSQGTSMSTPNATGAGALALARDGGLTPATLRAKLQAGARRDSETGAAANNDWGAGKLHVPGLMDQGLGGYRTPAGGTPPTATIKTPLDGAVLSGPVTIEVEAADAETPVASLSVQILVDGVALSPVTYDAADGRFKAAWTPAADGPYTLGATVSDGALSAVAPDVRVTVDAVDDAPSVAFVSPRDGDRVQGNPVTIEVSASDDRGVSVSAITVDGVAQAVTFDAAAGTWSASWDTTGLADGSTHTLSATATDGVNPAVTTTITVTFAATTKGGKGGGGGGGGKGKPR